MGKYQRIQKLCKERGVSVAQMERDLGFARGSIAKIDAHQPSMSRVSKICNYLNVSPIALLVDEYTTVEELREAKAIQDAINELPPPTVETPVYEVSCGNGRCNEDYGTDEEYSTIKICGDSMLPSLKDGDLVKVRHTTEVSPSDFAVIRINGNESVCKHVEVVSDGIIIHSENPAYEDVHYTVAEVLTTPIQIIGVAMEIVSRRL